MKKGLFLSLMMFFFINISAQPALVELPLYGSNDAGDFQTIYFGLDPFATNDVDTGLEEELPPLPPSTVFDIRFTGNPDNTGIDYGNGLAGDYRLGNTATSGQRTFQVGIQKGQGTNYTIGWNLPDGVTGILRDPFGGVIVNVSMSGEGSHTITNEFIVTLLVIINFDLTSPAINGDLSESDYLILASKQNPNLGFGEFIDIAKIVYRKIWYINALYLGIEGKLDTGNDNGIGLWLGFTETSGSAIGTSLGGDPGGHYMGGNGGANAAFKADFEVDYMFAMNPGGFTSNLYLDAVKLVGARAASYIGTSDQAGNTATGPSLAGIFRENSVSFAFVNGGATNKGFEICLPFSELGVTQLGEFQAFAFVVSSTAYFSDVTVPGNITNGLESNPGFDPNFGTISGGPFHSGLNPLPVELNTFNARAAGNKIELNWETASEIDNYGFEVERKSDHSDWKILGFVEGHGMSSSPKYYSFTDNNPEYGTLLYRLKQIDTNGGYEYSETVEVNIGLPDEYLLKQNYPNPFNPATKIAFVLPQRENVKVAVYNTLGEQVIELANREFEAGLNEIEFKADGLSSGIYFYRVEASNFSDVKKMILLR